MWGAEKELTPQRFAYRLKEAVEVANGQIHAHAKAHPEVRGMGTTTTAAGVLLDHVYITQVGDSRAYLIRNGVAVQLTKDQSLMQRLVEAGELTEEEAAHSERRNIILQALGPDPKVKVDLTHQEIRRGDVLVLCSDGLSGQVKREEIAEIVGGASDLAQACERLIAMANARGGPDNITVIVARFDGDGLRRAQLGESRPVKSQFRFLSGARVGQTEAFVKAYVGLGRHPLSDVRFDAERDLDVSARHAAIVRRGETFVIQDLGSRNGTFVNGTRITGDTPLHDGDVIGFGAKGPAVEFRILGTDDAVTGSTVAEAAAGRASQPRRMVPAAHASPAPSPAPGPPPPPPPSTSPPPLARRLAH